MREHHNRRYTDKMLPKKNYVKSSSPSKYMLMSLNVNCITYIGLLVYIIRSSLSLIYLETSNDILYLCIQSL